MAKILYCNDVVPGCDGQVSGETEEEVLGKAVEHAREAHGMTEIDAQTAAKVRAAIRSQS